MFAGGADAGGAEAGGMTPEAGGWAGVGRTWPPWAGPGLAGRLGSTPGRGRFGDIGRDRPLVGSAAGGASSGTIDHGPSPSVSMTCAVRGLRRERG